MLPAMNVTRHTRSVLLAIVLLIAGPTACRDSRAHSSAFIAEWVHALYGAIRVERLSPPVASRIAAYASMALYAGVAATDDDLAPLHGIVRGMPPLPVPPDGRALDATIVGMTAEQMVLDSLFQDALPATRAALARLTDSLVAVRAASGVAQEVQVRSVAAGAAIGAGIVAWSKTDGFAGTRRAYAAPEGAGLWRNDSPASLYTTQSMSGASEFIALDNPNNAQRASNTSDRGLILSRPKDSRGKSLPAVNMAGATEPYWREVRPFALDAWNACPIADPPPYSPDTTSVLYALARMVYETKHQLSPEQKAIALFWADNAGETGTPVGHWLSIAGQMIGERQLSERDAATLVLATALSQADAFIAAWGYKYQFNVVRPRMYIRRVIDSTWEPLIPTPPFPEYPAGHSTQSAAAATVMTALLGATPFSDSTSVSLGHAVRTFPSFLAASAEAGMSRIYGGIHFPAGNTSGAALGACVGDRVMQRMRAAARPPTS